MAQKTKIQLIEKQITKSGELVRISETLDRDFKMLKGIAMLWTSGKGHLIKSSSIDGRELFPKNFEVAFIQSNTYVAPNDRFFNVDQEANGYKLEMEIQDGGISAVKFPYALKIYLLLANE